jgi:hypothetical protein
VPSRRAPLRPRDITSFGGAFLSNARRRRRLSSCARPGSGGLRRRPGTASRP